MVLDSLREFVRPDPDGPAVSFDKVTETFRLYHERPTGLKERLYRFRRASYTDFNALEGVSFEVRSGETVGVIGPNGSGKSTLLKVLARILEPDEGTVEINGSVASLLELGAGFHGDLSGRENIFLNGAILGLTQAQIRERFDEIVEFAGVEQFLDTPVRNYSSGMYVRLGFAIAVTVEPDILLVDEVLSVGDARFQARSMDRMRAFQASGRTLIVVSHDLSSIEQLCDRTLVLNNGRLTFDGPAREGVRLYEQMTRVANGDRTIPDIAAPHERPVRIEGVELTNWSGSPVHELAPSSQLILKVHVRAHEDIDAFSVGAEFRAADGTLVHEVHSAWQGLKVGPLRVGESTTIDIRFTAHVLAGHYRATPLVTDPGGRITHDSRPSAVGFDIQPTPGGAGLVDFLASTSISDGSSSK